MTHFSNPPQLNLSNLQREMERNVGWWAKVDTFPVKNWRGGKKRFKTATLLSTYALTGPYFANLHKGYGVGASDNDGFGAK